MVSSLSPSQLSALLSCLALMAISGNAVAEEKPLKVFILAGQRPVAAPNVPSQETAVSKVASGIEIAEDRN